MKRNNLRLKLAYSLHKQSKTRKENIWNVTSRVLLSSRKNRPSVNLSEISRNSKDSSKILVPGKVLGGGNLNHKVTVVAYSFSQAAKEKIDSSGGKCMSLGEFVESNPDSSGVILLG